MEPQKLNNSNPSSPESDHNPLEKPKEDSATASATDGVGRSYECTFCKRGFTNAQALGGHMNIHRKDKDKAKAKAKAKQKNQEDLLIQNFKSNENYKNLSYFPDQISSTDCNLVFAGHVNYQVHLPLSNPGFQTGNDQYNRFPVWRPDHLKDQMDANPSLSIGLCPPVEDEEEVDLELRLGPYS